VLWRYIQESDGLLSQLLQQHIISSAYFYTQLCMLAPLDVYTVAQRTLAVACTAGVTSVRSPSVLTRACPSPPSVPRRCLPCLPTGPCPDRPLPSYALGCTTHVCEALLHGLVHATVFAPHRIRRSMGPPWRLTRSVSQATAPCKCAFAQRIPHGRADATVRWRTPTPCSVATSAVRLVRPQQQNGAALGRDQCGL
jgi:hypothetical protein